MDKIWWSQVTNAVKYISDIKASILDEKSIIIRHSKEIPWKECFQETVQEAVKLQNSEKKFVQFTTTMNPGEYLLNEFCKKEKRAEYRPMKGYAKFLAGSDDIVLHDRYLWISVPDEKCLVEWTNFVTEYIKERGKRDKAAVFILEWEGTGIGNTPKGIKTFSFDDYIGEYDRLVFAMLASSNTKMPPFIQDYTAELVASIAGNDIELCATCLSGGKEFLENPIDYVRGIEKNMWHSSGTPFVLGNNNQELEHLIWRAQIKTVYPFLEEYREEFVQKHEPEIAKQLPIQTSYGDIFNDPKDVELGTLLYMAGNGSIKLPTKEYSRLKRYREARNKLAHLSVLDFKDVEELL